MKEIKLEKSEKMICYTIGHSNHSFEQFLQLLNKYDIKYLIDVRSVPYSKYQKQFGKENISGLLSIKNITYEYLGDFVGGKSLRFHNNSEKPPTLKELRNKQKFQEGINKIIDIIKCGNKVVLMCSEKDPLSCHRFLLISYCLQEKGIDVIHILHDGKRKDNLELEDELRPDPAQSTLFPESKENLDELYEKQALKVINKYKGNDES
ncbi:MAG TPA: DUF488 domain-containing protein [candidate division Zixibacteria bacterium]|nr:DUF488 domain-containing protein [candidate division Zixibacteria bacterium]